MASYFPKALWYKEWKQHRGKVLLAFCLFSLTPIGSALLLWLQLMSPHAGNYPYTVFWNHFNQNLNTFSASQTGIVGLITVIVMAAVLVTTERTGGTLWYTLSTPVRRDEWLRTKFLFGLAIIVGSFTILAVWQGVVAGSDPQAVTVVQVLRWYISMLAIHGSIYAIAFVASVCVSSVIGAIIATVAILEFPLWFNVTLRTATRTSSGPAPSWAFLVGDGVRNLSPFSLTGNLSFTNPYIYWYLGFILIGYAVSEALFIRIRAEHLDSLLTFPKLWYGVFGAISVLVGSLFADSVAGMVENSQPSFRVQVFTPAFIIISILAWVVLYGISQILSRRKLRHSS